MSKIIEEFKAQHGYTDGEIANLINDELKQRDLPPTSIARPTVTTWRLGTYSPDPLLLEWLRDHAEDERVKTLAGAMIEALRGE